MRNRCINGTLTINSGVSLSTIDGIGEEIVINGTFLHKGTVPDPMNGTGSINSGGTYIHNTTSSAARMVDFFSSKNDNSNWIYRGSSTLTPALSMGNKTFGNLSIESTSGSYSLTYSGTSGVTVNGNFQLGSNVTLNITNTAINSFKENYTINGIITYSTGTQNFAFNGISPQIISGSGSIAFETMSIASGANVTLSNNVNINNGFICTVNGTLDCGASSVVSGLGAFTLASGATLKTANATGINSSITVSGAINLHAASNYEFNGTSSQVTGALLPATVNNFTIDNAAGVKLSNTALTVSGTMTINSGKLFTLESGKQLTVTTTLSNHADNVNAGLVLEDGASLITFGTVSGGATVKRNISNDMVSHFLSSPVSGQAFKTGFIPGSVNTTFEFYYFDETVLDGKPWINSRTAENAGLAGWTNGTFEAGRGYLCAYNATWGTEHTFAGTLLSGAYSPAVTNTPAGGNGWNLIGNPYPSSIDWNHVTKPGVLNSFYYVYDPTANQAAGKYRYHNGTAGSTGATQYIASEQAFFVYASDASTLNLTNSDRAHSSQGFVKSTNSELSEFALELKYGNYSDEAKVGLSDVSQQEQDNYDAYKLYSFTAGLPYLYTLTSDGTKVAYNSIPEITSTDIRLGVVIPQAGQYTINLSAYQGNFEFVTLVLQDLLTGVTQDLKQNPLYTFTGDPNGDANRFLIKFANVGIENPAATEAGIYTYGNILNILNPGNATLEVYNMAGQRVLIEQINSSGLYQTTLNNRSGYYVVRLTNAGQVKVSKVLFK
jgi:hypothetical protein